MRTIAYVIILILSVAGVSPLRGEENSWFKRNNVFDHISGSFTAGTTGLGFEVEAPATRWANVRSGMSGMPKFNMPLNFSITTYSDGVASNHFSQVQELMYKITGKSMDENVTMNSRPNILNFKLLVDIFPFQGNRHWHFTAGFYLGTKIIGRTLNAKSETESLVALNIYNRLYDRVLNLDPLNDPFFGSIYITPEQKAEIVSYGEMGIHIGDYRDGTPYYMKPAPNGTVSANAVVNHFKPYIGAGYSTTIDRDHRLSIGGEIGMWIWGGVPQVIIHDGVNMNKDLKNVRGKIGDYLNLMKSLPVYPVVEFKISYNIM